MAVHAFIDVISDSRQGSNINDSSKFKNFSTL